MDGLSIITHLSSRRLITQRCVLSAFNFVSGTNRQSVFDPGYASLMTYRYQLIADDRVRERLQKAMVELLVELDKLAEEFYAIKQRVQSEDIPEAEMKTLLLRSFELQTEIERITSTLELLQQETDNGE